jgi:hypothetical protein
MLYVIQTVPRHIRHIASHLRQADLNELHASMGQPPLEALSKSVRISAEAYTLMWDRLPVALMGHLPSSREYGIVWMMGTDRIKDCALPFARGCKEFLDRFAHQYPYVCNIAHTKNTLHLRWLAWMGCEFHETHTLPSGEDFVRFTYV